MNPTTSLARRDGKNDPWAQSCMMMNVRTSRPAVGNARSERYPVGQGERQVHHVQHRGERQQRRDHLHDRAADVGTLVAGNYGAPLGLGAALGNRLGGNVRHFTRRGLSERPRVAVSTRLHRSHAAIVSGELQHN